MIEIYRDNEAILSVSNKNATHKDVVMGDNNVKIDLVVTKELDVKDGDYIVFKGIKYTQNRDVEFVKRSAICFEYYCEFEHPLYRLLDKLFIFNLTNSPVFTLTGKLADFVNLVIWNMNLSEDNPQGIDESWTIGSIIDTDYLSISFDSINCKDALSMIAGVDYFNAEYYFSENGKKINFTAHIENETGLVFEQGAGKGLYSIKQENVDTKDTVTRVYPVGGTQNVPNALADGNGNLKLPELFLQDTSEYSRIVEKRVVFDSIFPHFLGTIGSVAGDNNEMIFCSQIDFDLNEIAVGENARINFITGDLMGISFQFSYDNALQRVTLIEQEDTVALAGDDGTMPMVPSLIKRANVGDKFNFTGVIMPETYNTNAITELREKGSSFLAFYKRKRVKFVLDIDNRWMRNKTALKAGDLVRIKIAERGIDTPIRITDISTSLYDGKVSATVSNYLDENWEKQVEGKLSSIKTTVISGNYGGSEVDILQQSDARPVSDRNVMSGLRSRKEFLRKDATDTAAERISFDKGFDAYNFEQGQFLGSGLGVFEDGSGNSVLEVDKLNVRKEAWFNEIVINQIRFQGGIVVYSAASLEVLDVLGASTYYRVKFDTKNGQIANQFAVEDQVRCQRFVGGSVTKYYMSRVTSVGTDYINLSRQDYDGTLNPEVGDMIVQFGNRTDVNRQALIEINALYGGKQTFYNGVNSYSLTDKNIIDIGRVLVDNQLQNLIRVYGNAYVGSRNLSSYFKFDSATGLAEFKGKFTFQSGKTDDELENEIAGFGSDGIITPAEKRELKIQWDEIAYEFQALYDQGDGLSCASFEVYGDAYSALYNYLFVNPNLLNPDNMGIDSIIVPSAYKLVWSNFLKSRAALRTEIADAINLLVDMVISDGVLTPAEKLQLKSMWDGMVADHGRVVRRGTAAGITAYTVYTTFVSKYNALVTYLDPIFTTMGATSAIVPATFKTVFSDYTTAKAEVEKYLDERDEQTIASMIADINKAISDSWITPAEKRGLKIQWDTITSEVDGIYAQAEDLGCDNHDLYYTSFTNLSNYLSLISLFTNMAESTYIANVTTFKAYWIAYYQYKEIIISEINSKLGIKASAADYLIAAMQGSTDITGGLLLTNLLLMKSAGGSIRGGMSGLVGDPVGSWAGGTYEQALTDAGKAFKSAMESAALDKKSDGSGHRAFGNLAWNAAGDVFLKGAIEALEGTFGNLKISGNTLVNSSIKITTDGVPNMLALVTPSYLSIARQSSWSGAYANSGTFEVTSKAVLEFKIQSSGAGSNYGWAWELRKYYDDSVVAYGSSNNSNTKDLQTVVVMPGELYYLYATPYVTTPGSPYVYLYGAESDDVIKLKYYEQRTVVADDGFYSFFNGQSYVYFKQGEQFHARIAESGIDLSPIGVTISGGTNGEGRVSILPNGVEFWWNNRILRISDSGFQKSTNAGDTWTSF